MTDCNRNSGTGPRAEGSAPLAIAIGWHLRRWRRRAWRWLRWQGGRPGYPKPGVPKPTWVLLAIAVLAVGVALRFVHLDRQVFWYDETIASVRIAGYGKDEVEALLVARQEAARSVGADPWISPADLEPYRRVGDRPWSATLASLAYENPEQAPLYYLLLRAWAQVFGDSPAVLRAFSAFGGLAAIALVYGLAAEWLRLNSTSLLNGVRSPPLAPRLPAVAAMLAALSPFWTVYSREARAYSWLMAAIAGSSWALLRALRRQTPGSWRLYGVTVVLGGYLSLSFALTAAAHGLYALMCWSAGENRVPSPDIRPFTNRTLLTLGKTFLASLLALAPWLYFTFTYRSRLGWLGRELDYWTTVQRWAINLTMGVADLQVGRDAPPIDVSSSIDPLFLVPSDPRFWVMGAVLAVYVWAFLELPEWPEPAQYFPLSLMLTVVPFAIQDGFTGGQRSTVARYFGVFYLGLALMLAAALAQAIAHPRPCCRSFGRSLLGLVLAAGVISGVAAARAPTWWNKYSSYYDRDIAAVVNASTRASPMADNPASDPEGAGTVPRRPLVVGGSGVRLLGLGRYLDPETAIALRVEGDDPLLDDLNLAAFDRLFLYWPHDDWRDRLDADPRYRLEASPYPEFWRVWPESPGILAPPVPE